MSGALQMTQQAAEGVSENAKAMMTPVEVGILGGAAGVVGAGNLIVKCVDAHSNTKTADAAVETAKANTKTSNANEMSARADVMNVGIAAKKLEFEIKQAEDKARNERKDQGPRQVPAHRMVVESHLLLASSHRPRLHPLLRIRKRISCQLTHWVHRSSDRPPALTSHNPLVKVACRN